MCLQTVGTWVRKEKILSQQQSSFYFPEFIKKKHLNCSGIRKKTLCKVAVRLNTMGFSLNGAELLLNSAEFRESEKSLKHG